jgi:uncharacterized membrane protein
MGETNEVRNENRASGVNKAVFITLGLICAVLSLFIYPFIFGVVGVIMGILVTKEGSKAGLPVIVTSIILMGIGLIYSGVILNYTRHYLGI